MFQFNRSSVCTSLKLLNNLKIFKNLKNTEFKILTISPGVVAAIRVVGVRADPCGAIRWTNVLHHKVHHVHLLHVLLPQHRD